MGNIGVKLTGQPGLPKLPYCIKRRLNEAIILHYKKSSFRLDFAKLTINLPQFQYRMITKSIKNLLTKKSMHFFSSEAVHALSPLKMQLIKQALPHVHKYGWSDNAILAACAELDLSPASHRIIRPYDMIAYCMRNWNQQALRKIDDTNFEGNKKIRDKVHYAIKQRLILQIEYIDTWNQAMAIGAHPSNLSQTKDLLWQYSDEVWRRCGDTATDYNYYTKRILFNSAYATTELHLLTDQSAGKGQSWKFLDRRIDDILWVGKGVGDFRTVAGAAFDGLLNLVPMFREPPASEIKTPIYEVKLNEPQTITQIPSDQPSSKTPETAPKTNS